MEQIQYDDYLAEFPVYIGDGIFFDRHFTEPHNHTFHEIFLVRNGCLDHQINDRCETLKERSAVFIRPDDAHAFRSHDGSPAKITNIAFDSSLFEQAVSLLPETRRESVHRAYGSLTCSPALWQVLLGKLEIIRSANPFLCEQTSMETISMLLDVLIPLAFQSQKQTVSPGWLRVACEQMDQPENRLLGLHRLVQLSGRSPEHLNRTMKKTMGITPGEYVTRLKLQHAAELLSTTDRTVLDILMDSGFNNAAWFNRCFKRKFGLSAGQYRQKNRRLVSR